MSGRIQLKSRVHGEGGSGRPCPAPAASPAQPRVALNRAGFCYPGDVFPDCRSSKMFVVMAISSQVWEGSFLIVYDFAIYIIL